MPAPARLAALRHLLAGRFPSATPVTAVSGGPGAGRALPTGLPAIDEAAGGLPLGALTEIVCAAPSCGGQLLLGQLLAATRLARARVALVDSHDSFDPASFPSDLLAHLVWVRGGGPSTAPFPDPVAALARRNPAVAESVEKVPSPLSSEGAAPSAPLAALRRRRSAALRQSDFSDAFSGPATLSRRPSKATSSPSEIAWALQATDLLVRDANLGLVVLDLRGASGADFQRTPATHWYRLQHAVETAGLPLVVQTPRAAVPSARIRFVLSASHACPALALERTTLLAALAPLLQRHRLAAAV